METLKLRPLPYDVFQDIPNKEVIFFRSYDVIITCFDASSNYFVFGTNVGCSYLSHRNSKYLIKILCDSRKEEICCVKIHEGVDLQIGMATKDGQLLISSFSLDISQENKKQRRKYMLGKIHDYDVTNLQWSVNGMKLFSADSNGNIFTANIDFHMNSCSSQFITKATDDVVIHMDYRHRHLLIVTSQGQVIIHSLETSKNDVIVDKDALGACYNYDVTISEQQLLIYVTLPHSCVRVFNIAGFLVTSYKDVTSHLKEKIEICLEDSDDVTTEGGDDVTMKGGGGMLELGRIRNLNEKQILSFADDTIVVYDHVQDDVIMYIRHVIDLCDVTSTKDDEILLFIRHNGNGRKILRIARTNERRLATVVGLEEDDVIDNIEKQLRVKAENLWSFSQKFSNLSSDAVDSIGAKLKKQIEGVGENIRNRIVTSKEDQEDDVITIEEDDDVTSQSGSLTSSDLHNYHQHPVIDRKLSSTSMTSSQYEGGASGILFESKLRKMKRKAKKKQQDEKQDEKQQEKRQEKDDEAKTEENQTEEKEEVESTKEENNDDVTIHDDVTARDDITTTNEFTSPDDVTTQDDVIAHDDVTTHNDVTDVEEEERRLFERLNFNKVTISSPIHTPIVEDITFMTSQHDNDAISSPPSTTSSTSSSNNDEQEDDDVIDFYARSDDDSEKNDDATDVTSSQLRHQVKDVAADDDNISIVSSMNLDMENMVTFRLVRDENAWSVCPAPSKNMAAIYAHKGKICVVTNSNRIWMAEEPAARGSDYDVTTSLRWYVLSKSATDISIANDVIWTVDPLGGVKCAPSSGLQPTTSAVTRWRPLNLKWSSVDVMTSQRQIRHVCLMMTSSGTCHAWMITVDGDVIERCNVTGVLPCGGLPERRIHVAVREADGTAVEPEILGICWTTSTTWLLSQKGKLFCKENSTTRWLSVVLPDNDDVTITRLSSDDVSTIFVVDNFGRVWFRSTDDLMTSQSEQWWQIHLNNYLYGGGGGGGGKKGKKKFSNFLQNLTNAEAKSSTTDTTSSMNYDVIKSRDVAITRTCVWILTQNNVLFTARGAITGYQWWTPHIEGMTSYCKWNGVTSSSMFSPESATWEEFVWISRHSGGELLRFQHSQQETSSASVIMPPKPNCDVTCISACKDALWIVTSSCEMFCRRGITSDLPVGRDWQEVDISAQFGDVTMKWVSCGSNCVWGIDDVGRCHMRVGSHQQSQSSSDVMVAAWLPVESPADDVIFKEVTCGPSSVNVWALDTRGRVYVRNDVTDEFPVGRSWTQVEGVPIRRIAISNHTVWAVSYWGNLLERCGIDHDNIAGDYWNQKITKIIDLTVTPQDQLWSINHEHRLKRLHKKIYKTPNIMTSQSTTTDHHDDNADEWEML